MTLLTGQTDGQAGNSAPGAGNQTPTDWRASLPDDLRSEKVFESIKGKDAAEALPLLAKNYLHAQRLVGADKIVLPNERSTPEEIAAFRTKLGVPAKFDDYSYKLPEGMTEDRLDKTRLDAWRKEMHEAGIPKAAAERIMNKFLAEEHGHYTAQAKAREKALQDNELALKQEFGAKFDERVNQARFALRQFGTDELTSMLEETGLGSHPEVVRFFAKVGEKMSDDRARGGSGATAASTATPDLAQAALQEFNRNPENMKALFDSNHPNHDYVVKQRRELFEAAYPKTAES